MMMMQHLLTVWMDGHERRPGTYFQYVLASSHFLGNFGGILESVHALLFSHFKHCDDVQTFHRLFEPIRLYNKSPVSNCTIISPTKSEKDKVFMKDKILKLNTLMKKYFNKIRYAENLKIK